MSSARMRVEGGTEYWESGIGWLPITSDYRITVQRQGSDGVWTSFNCVAAESPWQINAGPGVYPSRLHAGLCGAVRPSSTRAVRITAPKPATKRRATIPVKSAYYPNCAAARASGVAPILRGQPGYRAGLDRDGDGIACE